jgi:hypothetical protein
MSGEEAEKEEMHLHLQKRLYMCTSGACLIMAQMMTIPLKRPRILLTLVRFAASCWHATAAPRRGGPRRGFDVSCKLAQLGYKVGFFPASFPLLSSLFFSSLSLSLSLSICWLLERHPTHTPRFRQARWTSMSCLHSRHTLDAHSLPFTAHTMIVIAMVTP